MAELPTIPEGSALTPDAPIVAFGFAWRPPTLQESAPFYGADSWRLSRGPAEERTRRGRCRPAGNDQAHPAPYRR